MRILKVKKGDIVRGPGGVDHKVRVWEILAVAEDGSIAIGQNTRAIRNFRCPLLLNHPDNFFEMVKEL